MLSFNSRKLQYKNPFGAVATNQQVSFTFPINKSISLFSVSLILRKENIIKNIHMKFLGEEEEENIFVGGFSPEKEGIYYYRFEIYTQEGTIFVGKGRDGGALIGDWLPEWQLTVFDSSFSTPDWIKGGIIYHIFPDRFQRVEDNKRPIRGVFKSWYQMLSIGDQNGYRADDFYGGNIKGVLNKLPYLKSLGVTTIYFSPIFESSSNHRYDTGNYFKIDDLFGTEEEFAHLISVAKEAGISIILDGVFNHTGADSIYFNKFNHYNSLGAYQSKDSQYYDWFTFYDWPDKYECWWGVTVVPTISRKAKGFQEMIAGKDGVIDKWTRLGVSGWRLDVVDELSSEFVEQIRKSCKNIDKQTLVIGEVWEDASIKESYGEKRKYLLGKQLDGVMNYPFKDAIVELIRDGKIEGFINSTYEICENYPKCVLDTCMTLLGSHDTVRVINELAGVIKPKTKFSRSIYRMSPEQYKKGKERLKTASIIQYILPGVPSVYYGDETGMQGFEDPMNRSTFPTTGGDRELVEHYIKLGEFRKKYKSMLVDSGIEIYYCENLLHIKRGLIHLLVNLSGSIICLDELVVDLITGDEHHFIQNECAIVFLESK